MSTNDSKKPAVPKFASFKPKSAPSEATPEASSKADHGSQEDVPRHRHRHRHEAKDDRSRHSSSHDHRPKRHRSRSAERHTSRIVPQPEAARTKEGNEESLFIVDKRGDPLIIRYGSNDRNRIPGYRRSGAGRLLGVPGRMTIIRDGPKEVFSLGGSREGSSAFRDRSYLARVLRTKPRQFKYRPTNDDTRSPAADDEFLPLKQSRKRKRGQDEPNDSSDEEQPRYRSIYSKPKDHEGSDSDLDDSSATSSENDDDDDNQDPIKAKYIQLSRRVKDHPENIDSWFELAQAQASILRLGEDGDDQTKDGVKGLASVKLSLYEEALPHVQSDSDRERILLRLMREGSKVWSRKTLAKRWAEATEANPKSFSLWKGRLDFELTNLSTFTYDDLRKYHLDRLHLLRQQLLEKTVVVDEILKSLCCELTYVFLRTTRFLYDAGFTELAVAAWQAILEMTFARSTQTYASIEEVMDSFRDFWESEVPRIGEENAKGWRYFAEAEAMADLPEPQTGMAPKPPESRDFYKAWAAIEAGQTRNGRMPARTLDDGTEDDPYRIVMYSDIEPLLFYIPSPALPSISAVLLDAFLLFCGMPPISVSSVIKAANDDPFVFHGGKALELKLTTQENRVGQESEDLSKKAPPFKLDGCHMAVSPEVLFAGPHWFNYIIDRASLYPWNDEPLKYDWVVKAIRQVALTFGFARAAEYSLALSWSRDHNSSKKTAKALLKQYPSNVQLYNAYALAEWGNGNRDVARNVFLSATGLQTTNQNDKQLLWNAWAWKELEDGHHQLALSCLISSIEGAPSQSSSHTGLSGPPSSAQILKARQKLQARRDYLLSSGDIDHCGLFAESLVLLEYLTAEGGTESKSEGQGNISTAIRSVLTFSDDLISRTFNSHTAHERLLQFGARLLYFHANHGPFRPIFLRENLLRFIRLFPQNTMFMILFAWAESSLRIDDPVRDVLRRIVLVEPQDCLSSRIFAIYHENQVGNAHSTRAAFENALESEACSGSVALWISYTRFCYSRKELRHKAKDVFYRAVGSCPWSKELAMEAFTTLVKVMESSELRAVFNTMTSKGLRVHVDLEDFSAKWSRSQRPSQSRTR